MMESGARADHDGISGVIPNQMVPVNFPVLRL